MHVRLLLKRASETALTGNTDRFCTYGEMSWLYIVMLVAIAAVLVHHTEGSLATDLLCCIAGELFHPQSALLLQCLTTGTA